MNMIQRRMGRRQFLFAAGVTSTAALAADRLAGAIDPVFQTNAAIAAGKAGAAGIKTSGRYVHLMSPLKIGNVVLKNRMYSTAAVPHNLQGGEIFPAEPSRYYAAILAKNGAAIVTCRIITNRVRKDLGGDSAHMVIYDLEDYGVQNYLDQLVEGIHCYGSKAACPIELTLPGQSMPGMPSSMAMPGAGGARGDMPSGSPQEGGMPGGEGQGRGMSGDIGSIMASLSSPPQEISAEVSQELIDTAVSRAKFYHTHGFDVASLRVPNVKDRVKFGIELYSAVKKACGQDFLIESPITVIDPSVKSSETSSACTLDEAIALAKKWEGLADILQIRVSGGTANHPDGYNQDKNKPLPLRFAQAIKESGAKIIAAPNGGFNNLDFNEDCISTGKIDMIAMGRPFIADWEYAKKAYEGRGEDTVPCIMCNKCHGSQGAPWISICSVNPRMGIDSAVRAIDAPTAIKKVAVIGGGPAGLKAAVTAAERGHKVTLYEKNGVLGGQAIHADYSPYKWPLKDFKDYLIRQAKKLGVEILLNTTATPDMLKSKGYEAILVAIGSEPAASKVPGADGKNIFNVMNVWGNEKALGKNVVFAGGGLFGVETAVYLAKIGRNVTVLSSGRQLIQPTGPHQLSSISDAYQEMKNFTAVTGAVTKSISNNKVTYTDANGSEKTIQADSIVVYSGFKPRQEEAMRFSGLAGQTFLIGECGGVGDGIQVSQRSAFFAASQV
ncbi:MAG: FAD-dependent oxidoreductase [Deltaproteobacteria bacterium]|nr:FAD-dependent oxidoreductase [Deltaproteobacteria bacterium]